MQFNQQNWQREAQKKQKENKQFLEKTKRKRGLEKHLPALHEEAFTVIDCLQCGNCCKTISPRFKKPDLERIAKYLGVKQSEMIARYLHLDTDGDYVVKNSPCPFLGSDNYCSIYEVRPRDCQKYPYTDSGDFFQYTHTTFQNSTTCPAVFFVLERLKQIV